MKARHNCAEIVFVFPTKNEQFMYILILQTRERRLRRVLVHTEYMLVNFISGFFHNTSMLTRDTLVSQGRRVKGVSECRTNWAMPLAQFSLPLLLFLFCSFGPAAYCTYEQKVPTHARIQTHKHTHTHTITAERLNLCSKLSLSFCFLVFFCIWHLLLFRGRPVFVMFVDCKSCWSAF